MENGQPGERVICTGFPELFGKLTKDCKNIRFSFYKERRGWSFHSLRLIMKRG
jgi:hypothetical protein